MSKVRVPSAEQALWYIGPRPEEVGVVPLPEGWPAFDHRETDDTVRAAKLESGFYALPGSGKTLDELKKE